MPNVSLPAAAATLGLTATQMLMLMRNAACPAPTANPGTGLAAITFDQAAITALAATLAQAKSNGWKVTAAHLPFAKLVAMAANPPGASYVPPLSDPLFDIVAP